MISKALLLVDFQNEWVSEFSAYYVGDIKEVIHKVKSLIDYAKEEKMKVVFTQHIDHESNGAFAKDSHGIQIIQALYKEDKHALVTKHSQNPFDNKNLEQELEGVDEVMVVGILTNECFENTVTESYDRGIDVTIVQDCCIAFDEESKKFTFDDIKHVSSDIEFVNMKEIVEDYQPLDREEDIDLGNF